MISKVEYINEADRQINESKYDQQLFKDPISQKMLKVKQFVDLVFNKQLMLVDKCIWFILKVIYYSGSRKMKGTTSALFGVATCHRLVTGRYTRNSGVMVISVE